MPRPVGVAPLQGELLVNEPADGALADACRARGLEPMSATWGGASCIALGSKDVRHFRYMLAETGAAPRVQSGLTRVSLIGDRLDRIPGAADTFSGNRRLGGL